MKVVNVWIGVEAEHYDQVELESRTPEGELIVGVRVTAKKGVVGIERLTQGQELDVLFGSPDPTATVEALPLAPLEDLEDLPVSGDGGNDASR